MSVDPVAAAAFRVPRSYADGLYVRGEQGPASRVGVGVVVSVDGHNLATVVINDEEVTGVMWLGTTAPRVDDVVEVEMRGDLLVIPALNDLDAFLEGQENTAAHIVSDTDPGAPPAEELQVGGSMRGLDAWQFLGAEVANWVRELGPSGQGMRVYQTGQPTFVARNMATIPSGEAGIGPNDAGFSWTALDTQAGTYNGLASVETSTEHAYANAVAVKATWVADPKPSGITLRVGGHTIGAQYTARAFVYVPAGSQDVRLVVQTVTGSAAMTVKDTWTAVTVTYTATAAEHIIGIATPAGGIASQVGTAYLDAFSVVAGAAALSPYFDGSTSSSATEKYIWNGTPHLSTSEHWTGPVIPSVLLRANAVTNPSFEVNTTGWSVLASGVIARVTTDKYVGAAACSLTGPAGGRMQMTSATTGVVTGETWTGSAYVKGTAAATATLNVWFYNVGTYVPVAGDSVTVTLTGDWQRVSHSVAAPAGADRVRVQVQRNAADLLVDAAMLERTSVLGAYFDGDTPDAEGQNYQWTGTAHASTSTLRTLPIGNPPATTGTLWSEEFIEVSPGDTIGFDVALMELANAPTAQLVVSYGSAEDAYPPPTDPATLTVTMGAAVAVVGPDVIISRTTVVPDTATFPGPGAAEPKTARLGIKFTGNAAGTAQALVLKATATLTPKGWPLGSLWMDPDAETGGLVTINDTGLVANTATLASTTVDTPIPNCKRAVVTSPEATGGIAVVTFTALITFQTATSSLYLRLVKDAITIAFAQLSAPTAAGTFQVTLRGSVLLAAGEEANVVPMYAYAGAGVTTPHVLSRMVTGVDYFPGAVRTGTSTDPMIRYWDGDSWRPAMLRGAVIDLTKDANTTPGAKTATTTSLARSTSSIGEGSTLTLTSTTTSPAPGTVTFYRSASAGGPWTSLGTATITATKAVKTWTAEPGSWFFRATYGGSPLYNPSTSAATPVTNVLTKVSKTLVIPCAWARAYEGDGTKLTGSSHDNAVAQGFYGTPDGNTKSLLRFDNTAIPAAADVTSVSLVCKAGGWDHWHNPAAPVLIVGSFNNTPAEPATYVATDKYEDRSRIDIPTVTALGGSGGFTANISSWAKASVKAAIFSGLIVGPGPSNSQSYYGFSIEPGRDQFTLKVTYDSWE